MSWLLKLVGGSGATLWIILAVAVFSAGAGGTLAWKYQGARLEAVQVKYDSFVAQTKVLGDAQLKQTQAIVKWDKANKEAVDAKNKRLTTELADAARRLRDAYASSGGVPAAPAGSSRPDLACFDRSEFAAAYGRLADRVLGLAEEGTKATLDLDSAREWATGLKMSQELTAPTGK